jgi:integrase
LTTLTSQRVERFYSELRRCRVRCDGRPFLEHRRPGEHDCVRVQCRPHEYRPLASSSVLVLHAILSGALEAAVRWDWVSINVARAARRPKVPPPHPDPPTPEQAAILARAAWEQDLDWGTLVWLVMTTGMRRGEVLALRWRHVHFDRRILEIRRNYIQRRGCKIEKDTKTHQMRRIALDPDTIAVLTEHRDRARHRATLLGEPTIDDWYLFSHDPAHGVPLNPDWVTHRYTDMAAELGITTHLTRATALQRWPPNSSTPASTWPPCPAGSDTAGEAPPPCASTPPPINALPRYSTPQCRSDAPNRAIRRE